MTGDERARIASARKEFAKRYPFALIVRAFIDRNKNFDCECAAAGPVVYVEFAFGRDGKLCPRYHPSLYCAGCGETWHPPWRRELWESLTSKEGV